MYIATLKELNRLHTCACVHVCARMCIEETIIIKVVMNSRVSWGDRRWWEGEGGRNHVFAKIKYKIR